MFWWKYSLCTDLTVFPSGDFSEADAMLQWALDQQGKYVVTGLGKKNLLKSRTLGARINHPCAPSSKAYPGLGNPKPRNPKPPTRQPQAPDPKPQTPTSNPKPQTPKPKPQTPNPKAPSPKPQAPSAKPQTL